MANTLESVTFVAHTVSLADAISDKFKRIFRSKRVTLHVTRNPTTEVTTFVVVCPHDYESQVVAWFTGFTLGFLESAKLLNIPVRREYMPETREVSASVMASQAPEGNGWDTIDTSHD